MVSFDASKPLEPSIKRRHYNGIAINYLFIYLVFSHNYVILEILEAVIIFNDDLIFTMMLAYSRWCVIDTFLSWI